MLCAAYENKETQFFDDVAVYYDCDFAIERGEFCNSDHLALLSALRGCFMALRRNLQRGRLIRLAGEGFLNEWSPSGWIWYDSKHEIIRQSCRGDGSRPIGSLG